MDGKSVLSASVTGTVTPKDDKDSEVSCLYFNFTTSSLSTKRETPTNYCSCSSNGETYGYNEKFK